MTEVTPYFPQTVFGDTGSEADAVRVILAPHRYIQGKGALDNLGRYVSLLPSSHPLILISPGGKQRFGKRIEKSLTKVKAEPIFSLFEGECSHEGVRQITASVKTDTKPVDAVIAVGGGKCLDTGKCVAFRLNVPCVICPTIASTDAPCSAVSVMYTEEGVGKGPEFFPDSPSMVIMDSGIIAASPIRHLIAGMGDALATYFEARTCFRNPNARNMVGARPTLTAFAIAELCAKTVLEEGTKAIEAMKEKTINESLERIIEANTLLSGMGFESGGLAAAHAVAAGLTVIPTLHKNYLHGELVGMGIMTHLILEKQLDEARKVADFLASVGLPVHPGQLSLDPETDREAIENAMTASVESGLTASEPFTVTPDTLLEAFIQASRLGFETVESIGEKPYLKLNRQSLNPFFK